MTDSELPEVTIIPNLTFQIIPPAVQIKDEPPEPPPPPPPQAVIIPPSPTEVTICSLYSTRGPYWYISFKQKNIVAVVLRFKSC